MTAPLEFGLDTFGDVTKDATGAMLPHAQVIRNVVDEAVLATSSASTSSGSASITEPISRSPRPKPCSPRSHRAPGAFISALP